jgi:hypothetical protein
LNDGPRQNRLFACSGQQEVLAAQSRCTVVLCPREVGRSDGIGIQPERLAHCLERQERRLSLYPGGITLLLPLPCTSMRRKGGLLTGEKHVLQHRQAESLYKVQGDTGVVLGGKHRKVLEHGLLLMPYLSRIALEAGENAVKLDP